MERLGWGCGSVCCADFVFVLDTTVCCRGWRVWVGLLCRAGMAAAGALVALGLLLLCYCLGRSGLLCLLEPGKAWPPM